jgi:hypothetical protein
MGHGFSKLDFIHMGGFGLVYEWTTANTSTPVIG